jgi:peptide/nickel transport system substrate-binding protein
VTLAQLDGTRLVYTGTEPAQTVQMTAVFRLKPGLLWADGQPLTAADSLFSFQIASDPKTPVTKFAVERTARYELVDDVTVRWTGLPGWFDPQYALRFWTPLPRHQYGTFTAEQLLTRPDAIEHPLGWGPFVVSEWLRAII